jgi:hypothetical protein
MKHPFLLWYEAALLRWLVRSPRIGLVLIKQKHGALSWVIEDKEDTVPMPTQEVEVEPPSMLFERMYHAPDADPPRRLD